MKYEYMYSVDRIPNTMVSEGIQTQYITYCLILFMENITFTISKSMENKNILVIATV